MLLFGDDVVLFWNDMFLFWNIWFLCWIGVFQIDNDMLRFDNAPDWKGDVSFFWSMICFHSAKYMFLFEPLMLFSKIKGFCLELTCFCLEMIYVLNCSWHVLISRFAGPCLGSICIYLVIRIYLTGNYIFVLWLFLEIICSCLEMICFFFWNCIFLFGNNMFLWGNFMLSVENETFLV